MLECDTLEDIHSFNATFLPVSYGQTLTTLIRRLTWRLLLTAQNEWTLLAIHDRRSGKLECTSAFNKLWIRGERAPFGPQALIKLICTTSLALKLNNNPDKILKWMIYQWFKQNR